MFTLVMCFTSSSYSQPVRNTVGLWGPVVTPPVTGELTGPPAPR